MTVWDAIFKFYICKHKNGEVKTLVWHKTIQYTTPPALYIIIACFVVQWILNM